MKPSIPPVGARLDLRLAAALAFGLVLATTWATIVPALPDPLWLQAHQQALLTAVQHRPWSSGLGFFLLFTLLSALALPGCGLLALGAGLCFGWLAGTLLVLLASTVGATLSFLAARHLWRDTVQRRWGHRLVAVEAGLARDGAFYLLALRLAPVIPYIIINPLMGLSSMPTLRFFAVSLLGMFAGSAAYVYAGTTLGQAASWGDLLSPGLMAVLVGLALLPWLVRAAWRRHR
jgi:uncharacterized membrane protein YdjX (TVP38/TMEM64 family)